ncbi:family 43 glycosylhydrolase [Luteolibacter marinus]|uniref:family 43 glycosylhydrolase n=1 Tax=Luteolibacter marinus TaxID=2776705 RepID=UPI00186823DC|nr:family 43 glycosylhydrolase [Luteolibacter marinus]
MSGRLLIALLVSPLPLAANPVAEGADPHAIVIGRDYWMYPTEARSRRPVFAAYRSTDLRSWRREGTILELDKIPWIKDDGAPRHAAWAPALAVKNRKAYFYYSVGPQNPTPSRIGVAVGNSPAGPFKDSGKPLLTGGDGFEAIDPMVFVDPSDGKAWFYAGGSAGATLRVFEMADDMISFKREVAIEQPPKFTEGAFMHRRGKTCYLSYSHGKWNDSSYSVHYCTAPSPTGPWTYRGAILESDDTHQGPGHHSFVENPVTKQWFIVYHRWETSRKEPPMRGGRKIAVEKVDYDNEGLIRRIRMTDGKSPASPIPAAARD